MFIPSPATATAPVFHAIEPVCFVATPLNVFIAVLPLVLSCILHPIGGSCGFDQDYSYLVRVSPFSIVMDTIILLGELCATGWNRRSVQNVAASRYNPSVDYRARTILSSIMVLEFIKINSYTGLPFTLVACSVLFCCWLILEVVFLAACLSSPWLDVWDIFCDETPSSIDDHRAISWCKLHLVCVGCPAGIFATQIQTDNVVLTWYCYVGVILPLELSVWVIDICVAGTDAENVWLYTLGLVWFIVSLLPAIMFSLLCAIWAVGAVLAPAATVYFLWQQLSDGSRMHATRCAVMVWSRFRNLQFGMVLALLGFVWFWSICLFDPEGTGKQGRFESWP